MTLGEALGNDVGKTLGRILGVEEYFTEVLDDSATYGVLVVNVFKWVKEIKLACELEEQKARILVEHLERKQ